MILIVAGRTDVLRIGVDMLYDMFDFENHNPEDVKRVIKDLYDHPDMCDWYNYVGDYFTPKARVGSAMCWIRDVFQHATDADLLRDTFELEDKIMPYWIRDLYDAAMGYFDALDALHVEWSDLDEDDDVSDDAAKCYQRRAQATYENMSQSEKEDWDKLEFDVAVMVNDYLRAVMPTKVYTYDKALGHSKSYDQYINFLKCSVVADTKSFERYVFNPDLWYREWYQIKPEYNPYLDDVEPVVPIKPAR